MENIIQAPPFVTVQKAAELIGVSKRWIYKQSEAGKFPLKQIEGRTFVVVDDMLNALKEKTRTV